MSSGTNFTQSKGWKNFMSKLYGFGASVVIVGALFKIMHWPGAGPMLIIGLSTEAIIFFFSAFEPPHSEPDWTLVYPQLAGLPAEDQEDDILAMVDSKKHKGRSTETELGKMLEEANITPELIEKLGKGFQNLSASAEKLTDISNATIATEQFVQNVQGATKSVSELSETYKKSADVLSKDAMVSEEFANTVKIAAQSANKLSEAYLKTSEALQFDSNATDEYVNSIKAATNSAQKLAEKYSQSAETLTRSAEAIDFSAVDGKAYAEQLTKIARNLAALNNVYELQLSSSEEQLQKTSKLTESIGDFLSNLNETADNANKFKEQIASLAKNVAALNNIYGNMLSAMNIPKA